MIDHIGEWFASQAEAWPAMREGYASLAGVRVRQLEVRGVPYRLQCNPARRVSSAAQTDAASVAVRRCFLCAAHRPPEQTALPFQHRYEILVNPFPIFPRHLTIVANAHVDQRIAGRFGDLLALAAALPDLVVFYNGPRCGASAPDHAHFQAGSRGLLPLESDWHRRAGAEVARRGSAVLRRFDEDGCRAFVIDSPDNAEDATLLFDAICRSLPLPTGHDEPMMNLLAWREPDRWRVFVFPRERHRPACFPQVLCSPASVDLAGVFVLPQPGDFEALGADDVGRILGEVCLSTGDFRQACDRIAQNLGAMTSPAHE